MKTFAFYVAMHPMAHEGQPIKLPDGRIAYVRAVMARDGANEEEALDEAEPPRRGEQFMNTHTL